MLLRKNGWDADGGSSSAAMLGLKIVGGKLLENGKRGAIIERVKKGSVAELEGGLKPGKLINKIRCAVQFKECDWCMSFHFLIIEFNTFHGYEFSIII